MKRVKHLALAAASLAIVGLVISALAADRLWAAAPTAKEVSVVDTPLTHVGASPADLVRLESIAIPAGAIFQRRFLDGTTDDGPATFGYEVPAGMVLVITDMEWIFRDAVPETSVIVTLTTRNDAFSQGSFTMVSTARADGDGQGGSSQAGSTGFAVAAGRNLFAHSSTSTLQYMVLRGYLKPE